MLVGAWGNWDCCTPLGAREAVPVSELVCVMLSHTLGVSQEKAKTRGHCRAQVRMCNAALLIVAPNGVEARWAGGQVAQCGAAQRGLVFSSRQKGTSDSCDSVGE